MEPLKSAVLVCLIGLVAASPDLGPVPPQEQEPEPMFEQSTIKEGKTMPRSGFGPSACMDPFKDCNPSLCYNHVPGYSGGLNCPLFAKKDCPDDLSNFQAFFLSAGGHAECGKFTSASAIEGDTRCHKFQDGAGRICSKRLIFHPNNAPTSVAGVVMKRVFCSGVPEKCFTTKVGHCIENPDGAWFESPKQMRATEKELMRVGDTLKDNWKSSIFDVTSGSITEEWKCKEKGMEEFENFMLAY